MSIFLGPTGAPQRAGEKFCLPTLATNTLFIGHLHLPTSQHHPTPVFSAPAKKLPALRKRKSLLTERRGQSNTVKRRKTGGRMNHLTYS